MTLGWTPRRWPQFTVGYEYRWKGGEQSSLSWGTVSPDPLNDPGKAIRPGWVALEEAVHRWTLEIEQSWNNGLVADHLFVELYDRQSQGTYPGDSAADLLGRYREGYDHRQVVNVLRAENQFTDWLFLSGGYLFSHLEGDGAIGQSLESMTGAFPPFPGDGAPDLAVRLRSHTFNANALAGAWQGFRLTGGLQSEWQQHDGLGQWIAPGFPDPTTGHNRSGQDRLTLDQTVGLQYDRLPYTVLHAEGRWQQQWVDHRESALLEDGFADTRDFERQTDGQGRRQRYGLGVTLSPWTPVSLDAGYRWESRATTYDHRFDRDASPNPNAAGNGYPAFIRSRVIEGGDDGAILAPYDGQVVSVLSSANLVVNRSTDLRINHTFAHADYQPQQLSEGLPLGMRYNWHTLSRALIRRLSPNTTVTLRYAFFDYREPTFGGARDYTGHLVLAGLSWRWD